MKLQYLRAFIVLLAGLIALIINIKTGRDVTISLLIVLIVILVFYFIATLTVEILQRGLDKANVSEQGESEEKAEADETDEVSEENQDEDSFGVDEEEF